MLYRTIYFAAMSLLLISPQSDANQDINFFKYSVGTSYQYLNASIDNTELSQDLTMSGHALGLYYKAEPYQYIQFSTGIDYVVIDNDDEFSQTVKNSLTGEISTKESTTYGYSAYFETGLNYQLPQTNRFKIGMLAGYRYNDIDQVILRCESCERKAQEQFESAPYAKAYLQYQLFDEVHLQLNMSSFFSDSGFDNSVGLQISFTSF